jgi:saccharopine dehydrogenase (NADP+, L-glutamate forming)
VFSDLVAAISSKTKFPSDDEKKRILSGFKWLGLFSDDKITARGTPLDTLCATLEQKMQYEEGERDLVMLQHKFEIENADGTRVSSTWCDRRDRMLTFLQETRTSTMVEYGDPKGYSAMAKTVGVPCAVAVQAVLNGTISDKGVLAPMNAKINNPLMKELKEKYNIECIEKVVS